MNGARPVALAALALALAACGPGAPPPQAPPSTAPSSATRVEPTAPAASSWTMPSLVGSNLQDAQNAIQQLTGFGVAVTFSHDETGAGREQVLDRNWKVCTQNVPPGATITAQTRIDFGAVKLDERC